MAPLRPVSTRDDTTMVQRFLDHSRVSRPDRVTYPALQIASWELLVGMVLLACIACSSCAYVDMLQRRSRLQSQFDQDPSQKLAVRIAPEGAFAVEGRLSMIGPSAQMLVVATVSGTGEQIGAHFVDPRLGRYWLYLPAGSYEILAFADLDGDGVFAPNELVARSGAAAPVTVDAAHAHDGYLVDGPSLTIDHRRAPDETVSLAAQVTRQESIFGSLDDPFFDARFGEMGLYDPVSLFVRNQGFVFGLKPVDPSKMQVLFVHGVSGTPRDFKYLVDGLDRSRFQARFFFWPTGLPLDKMGGVLARVIDLAAQDPNFGWKRFVVVSHSVGGLVAESALRRVGDKASPALRGYISFAAAYGGSNAAKSGAQSAPVVVPSWRDIATGSDFIDKLASRPFPKTVPLYLFFAWGTANKNGPEQAGDGTISLRSQLDPRMQFVASRSYGFGESHVGILNNEAARAKFVEILNTLATH